MFRYRRKTFPMHQNYQSSMIARTFGACEHDREKDERERDVHMCDGTCFCWLKCVRVCVRVPCIGKQGLRKASTFTMDNERENVRTLRNQRSRRASDFRDLKFQMLDMSSIIGIKKAKPPQATG